MARKLKYFFILLSTMLIAGAMIFWSNDVNDLLTFFAGLILVTIIFFRALILSK